MLFLSKDIQCDKSVIMQREYHWPYPITQLKLAKKIKEESFVQNMQGSTTYFEVKR